MLRIADAVSTAEAAPIPSHPENYADVLNQVRGIACCLRRALGAIEAIQHHLAQIADLVHASHQSNRPPRERQSLIDEQIHSIDSIVEAAEFDGIKLLLGAWSVTLADPSGKGVRTLRLPCLRSAGIVDSGTGTSLTALANRTAEDPLGENTARKRSIIRSGMLQVAAAREEVMIFMRDAVEPLIQTLDVASTNLDAASEAANDGNFAERAGRLTRLDVLAHTCQDRSSSKKFARSSASHRSESRRPSSDNTSH